LVILCCVKFFCPEKPCFAVLPSPLQHVDIEKCLELGWDVLQESENSVVRVLVAEGVEYEAVFGYESVAISWNPVSS